MNAITQVRELHDSYLAGVTIEAGVTEQPRLHGWAAQLGLQLGIENTYFTDGIGGTGVLRENLGGDNYLARLPTHYASEPDAILIGGGGSNDSLEYTVPQIIDGFAELFTDARANLPGTKLIFMEGFAPPNGYSTFNDEYIDIRAALQAELTDVGVYYIDIATSAAWIDGNGYIGSPTGTGNSDIYIGGDGIHTSIAGGAYIRARVAPPVRAILADNGELLNQLI